MGTNSNDGLAEIYQFPVGGRAALAARRPEDTKSPGSLSSRPVNEAACSSSWYHEAAIQESKPARER